MSMAIACWVRDTALMSNQRDREYKTAMIGAMTTTKTVLNTKVSGMVGYDGTKYQTEVNQAQELMKSFPGLFKG